MVTKEDLKQLEREFSEATTTEDFGLVRALCFAGGGVSFALILLIAQIAKPMPDLQPTLKAALYCAAVALPIWVFIALSYTMWIASKLNAVELHESRLRYKFLGVAPMLALLLNGVSLFFVLQHFHELAAGLFFLSTVAGIGIFLWLAFAGAHIRIRKFLSRKRAGDQSSTP
jgi:hypothetical protein